MNMLVRFALEPEAVDVKDGASPEDLARHHAFLKKWHDLGELLESTGDFSVLQKAIKAMPLRFRSRWQKAMRHARRRPAPAHWHGLVDPTSTDDLTPLQGEADVALVDPVSATLCFGVPEAEPSHISEKLGLEICRFSCVQSSTAFEEAEETARRGIREGERTADFWRDRFSRLAESCQTVTIVDRYAVKPGAAFDGLLRFMKELDRSASGGRLTLFSSVETPTEEQEVVRQLRNARKQQRQGGISTLVLYVAAADDFKKVHDRYVRFDESVCEMGVGVEVLGSRSGKVFRNCSFTLKPLDQEHRAIEASLRAVKLSRCPYRM
jgi:hypothetical protein